MKSSPMKPLPLIYLTPEECDQIRLMAMRENVSVSKFVRKIVRDYAKNNFVETLHRP